MKIINALVFDGETFKPGTLYIKNGKFVDPCECEDTYDAQGKRVIPGLVDLHFHGCMRCDFCDGTQQSIHTIAAYEASCGVTTIAPATMTYTEEILGKIMDSAALFEVAEGEAKLVGINMEGPYISPDKIGAQNPKYVQLCDIEMFKRLQQRAEGLIKIIDVAPEEEGAFDFIDKLHDQVRISVAHTCATYEQASEAFDRGALQVTHLYNAMPGLHHRKPGPIVAALEHENVMVELIADGIHIHPAMVRLAFRLFGEDRMLLISDSMMATGLSDGEYSLGGQPVTVVGNKALLHNGTIAGSATNLFDCMVCAVRDMNVPLEAAVKAASYNPACALGIEDECGSLAVGRRADFIVLDENLNKEQVCVRGVLL